jgi:uncharacterized protein with FMN-binding domain
LKRVLLSITGTVVGLVALLDFKSHQRPLGLAAGVPPVSGNGTTTSKAPPRTSTKDATKGSSPSSTAAPAGKSGRFVGSAVQTQYGVVQVAVTVGGGKITDISFVQLTAFDQTSAQINSQAAPILVQETMSAQSARIDTVSGATYTSAGYLQSLQSALDRAGLR